MYLKRGRQILWLFFVFIFEGSQQSRLWVMEFYRNVIVWVSELYLYYVIEVKGQVFRGRVFSLKVQCRR